MSRSRSHAYLPSTFVTAVLATIHLTLALCNPQVPLLTAPDITKSDITLLVFDYPLLSPQHDQARNLLEQTNHRAIFYVDTTEITIRTESKVRSLTRHGHTIITTRCDISDTMRIEMALGFHVAFALKNTTCSSESTFVIDQQKVTFMKNEKALIWLRDTTRTRRRIYQVVQLMNEQQLTGYYDQMECETTAYGETRYRTCSEISVEYNERTGHHLHPFSDVVIRRKRKDDIIAHRHFVRRNSVRVELAYRHLKIARSKIWRNEERTLQELMLLLYFVSDDHISMADRTNNIASFLRLYRTTRNYNIEPSTITRDHVLKWPNYAVSIVLCIAGLLGLYASVETVQPSHGRTIARFARAFKARTADIAKIV